MPLYEFSCQNCGSTIEVLMSISSPNPTKCEKCNSDSLIKIISRSNFALKGQGWYETDFKRRAAAPACDAKADSPSSESPPPCPGGKCNG